VHCVMVVCITQPGVNVSASINGAGRHCIVAGMENVGGIQKRVFTKIGR